MPKTVGIVVVFLGALFLSFIYLPHSNGRNSNVVVTKGMPLAEIAYTLDTADVIPSSYAFIVAAKLSKNGARLQSGVYRFPDNLTIPEVIDILAEGNYQVQKWITIPEGSTIRRVASIVQKHLDIDSAAFVKTTRNKRMIRSTGFTVSSLEGYLLPDTYLFKITATAEEIVAAMAGQMREFLLPFYKRMNEINMTRHELLAMASIVEGETRLESERARVAGVYYNRLRRGMLLQADPTVQYIIPDGPRRLLYRDLRIDSRYNTYKYKGLPPGPINNPGKKAVLAALYPEKHKYLFFVADGKGGHIFSRNAAEHERAVAEYRKIQRARGNK